MNSQCSTALLESALAGSLPADDEVSLHRHLEECEECGAALERMAGGPAWCQEAAALLIGDELDAAVPTRDEWSEVDFTVEHLEPSDEPNVLGRLGGYDVLEIIGHGGMGVVLRAFDRELKRCVAIKVLAPHLAQSSLAKKRFAREAQAAAAVVHPHVLAIHQVQPNGRLPFLVMPLVAGESLAERLTAQGTLELKEILRIGLQAAAGLAAAHEQGLVHRDVKPANILLEKGVERAVLTDFGLARAADDVTLTRWGIIAGTPQYMSPEQARGEPLDGRSDLFSLGCVLYEMATGVSPFRTDSMMATLRRLVDDSPQAMGSLNPELPPWFIAIVDRLLEKDPLRRFNSAREVSELLEGCLAHVQQPAAVPLPASLVPHTTSRRWIFNSHRKGVIAMLGAFGFSLLGMVLWQASEAPDIAGKWTGEEWGTVVLEARQSGQYQGSYQDTDHAKSGTMQLKWSRVERRFNGTWQEGDERNGKMSLRLVGDEIRGAWTTGKSSPKTSGTPRLADLLWKRSSVNTNESRSTPAKSDATAEPVNLRSPEITYLKGIYVKEGDFVKAGQSIATLGRTTIASSEFGKGKTEEIELRTPCDAKVVKVYGQDRPAPIMFGQGSVVVELRPVHGTAALETSATTAKPNRLNYFTTGHSIKIACSADGKLIAVANGNPTRILQVGGTSRVKGNWKPTADILDVETGKIVVSLKLTTGDEDAVLTATERIPHLEATALAFSPTGNVVAVGTSVGQVKLFNARTGELIRSLDDEPAKLADKETPENWKSLRRAMGSVGSLAFSPDGSLLAMCGGSFREFSDGFDSVTRLTREVTGPGRLKVWDVKTGTLKHDLVGHTYADTVSFSPDGNLLASAGRWASASDNGSGVIIWNPQTGAKIRTITNEANGGTYAVAFSPNSKMIVIGSEPYDKENATYTTAVSLAHASSGITQWQHQVPNGANPKAFSPDGKSVLVLCGQSIRFLDAATGTVQREIKSTDLSREGRWDDFAIAPQGPLLVIGAVDEQEGSVEVWNFAGPDAAATPKRITDFPTGDRVKTIAYSADGKLIAIANGNVTFPLAADWKRSVEIWDAGLVAGYTVVSLQLTTQEEDAILAATEGLPHFEVGPLAFSPDGNVIAVGTGMGQVKLFNARTGEVVQSLDDEPAKLAEKETPEKLKSLRRAMGGVGSLAFSPDGSLLAMSGSSFEDVARNWGSIRRLGRLATGPGRLKVWDVQSGTLKHDLVGHSHAEAVSFSADGNLLASAGRWGGDRDNGNGVIIWNPQTGKKIGTIAIEANGGTHAVVFSPANKLVAIGSRHYDKENDTYTTAVSLTYALSGITEWQHTIPGWANPKAFSPDGKSVAVLCGGQSIRLFDTETGTVKHEIRAAESLPGGRWTDFAIAPQGHRLAIGGIDVEMRGFVTVRNLDGASADAR